MRNLIRALAHFQIEVLPPSAGSHWRARKDGRTYTIPAAHGVTTEIPDNYVRGVCKFFAIDERELRARM